MLRRYLTFLAVLTMLLALTAPAFAQTVLFGPMQYTRTAGPPNQFTDTFTLPSGTTPPYTLHIVNGNANGTNRISSATVTLTGTQILGPSDFGQNVAVIDRTVTLQASNTLEIRLTSAPGSFITISVLDTSAGSQPTALTPNPLNLSVDATGTLTAMLTPAPTAAHLLTVCRYVERNALRAHLVERAERWRWGSLWLRESGQGTSGLLVDDGPIARPSPWVEWVNAVETEPELTAVRQSVVRSQPFGKTSWVEAMVDRLSLHMTQRPQGRPKLLKVGV